jgi:hypothetical protein
MIQTQAARANRFRPMANMASVGFMCTPPNKNVDHKRDTVSKMGPHVRKKSSEKPGAYSTSTLSAFGRSKPIVVMGLNEFGYAGCSEKACGSSTSGALAVRKRGIVDTGHIGTEAAKKRRE